MLQYFHGNFAHGSPRNAWDLSLSCSFAYVGTLCGQINTFRVDVPGRTLNLSAFTQVTVLYLDDTSHSMHMFVITCTTCRNQAMMFLPL
jgi:hypothetical protein